MRNRGVSILVSRHYTICLDVFFLRFLKFEVLKLRDFAMYIVTFLYFVSFC